MNKSHGERIHSDAIGCWCLLVIIDARCTRRWRERSISRCIPLDSRIANLSSRGTRGRGGEEVQGLGGRSGGCGGGDGRGRKREEKRSLLTGPGTGRSNSRRFARCTSAALFLTAYTYMWRFQNKSVSRRNFVRTSRHDTIEQTLVNR